MVPSTTKSPWPRRAIVTAGMPYGNKGLHFGHIGGVFVPADCFARFLRDRIGPENVCFVSGTDCYGSPIDEGFRKAVLTENFEGDIADYVMKNHRAQKATLEAYAISLDIYEGSGIGHCAEIHQGVSDTFVKRLYENGHLHKRETLQFFDTRENMFLNGRQVIGRCPVQGCKSEHAYADECDLGHQYAPEDLIAPISTVSETKPEMRPVANWYFDLPNFQNFLQNYVADMESQQSIRPVVTQTIKEFLAPPVIYIKNEAEQDYRSIADKLPGHSYRSAQKGKQSFEIEFESIDDRDSAREMLAAASIRFRTSKTLVPFRISGNTEWGVKAPVLEGVEGLSIWCWPESLWAPLSFSIAYNDYLGLPRSTWKKFWKSEDAQVYQFIGQDNLYFYGVAQPALIEASHIQEESSDDTAEEVLSRINLIANYHILFGDKKASSSGAVKPPSADELLDFYNFEQLRAHFLALGLGERSVGFKPKPFEPDENKRNDPRVADPVLKESALLSNVFNRLARSCFYEAQKNFDGLMPIGDVSPDVLKKAHQTLVEYDATMARVELHRIMSMMDEFIRWSNKYWTEHIAEAEKTRDDASRKQTLLDCFFLLRIATLLMHPIVPQGTENICDYLCFDFDDFFCWNYDFDSMEELCSAGDIRAGAHRVKMLPPRSDFFEKHPSQFKKRV